MLEKGSTMCRFALAISKLGENEGSVTVNVANSGRNEGKKTSEKESLWCSYCKKIGTQGRHVGSSIVSP